MKKRFLNLSYFMILLTLFIISIPTFNCTPVVKMQQEKISNLSEEYLLPPPQKTDMILEETIFRRSSVRDFLDNPVSDELLSTILWAAYGYRDDDSRNVPTITGVHAAHVYILRQDGVYKYNPTNHSLLFHRLGDFTNYFQYDAPIQLGIVWDTNISTDEKLTASEIGMIGQNIYLMANALDLGTLATIGSPLSVIKLPGNEIPKIIMPLGHPRYPYRFSNHPLVFSLLPTVQLSDYSLSKTLEKRIESDSWTGSLTCEEIAQLLWSTYGYSYYIDRSDYDFIYHINRHRTVPSAHKYYPLIIYAVTSAGIYRYFPNIYDPLIGPLQILFNFPLFPYPVVTFLQKIKSGDYRETLAEAYATPSLRSAPLCILSVLDIERTRPESYDDFSGEELRWLWYYEAGASAYNALLETTAWNLSGNIITVTNPNMICSLLTLDNTLFEPMLAIPIGE